MSKQKFTVILLPQDEGGYQVFFPYYPGCITDGDTVTEALAHGKDALEGILKTEAAESGADPVPSYVLARHVVVSEVDIEVPENLMERPATARQEDDQGLSDSLSQRTQGPLAGAGAAQDAEALKD